MAIAADLLIFFYGVTCSFAAHLVGQLPVAEIIVIPLLPFLLLTQWKKVMREDLRPVYWLLLVGLFSQGMTDLYRRTQAVDQLSTDASILFFAMDIMFLAALTSGNDRRKSLFFIGFGIGVILGTRFEPLGWAPDYPWKFGYGPGVILLVVMLSCYFYRSRAYPVVVFLLAAIMAVNLVENFRSPILFLLVTIALVIPVIPERIGRLQLLPRSGRVARVLVLACMGLAAGGMAEAAIAWATNIGLAGESAREKNRAQMESKGGLLFGGRPEIFVSTIAVLDSPLLGHGARAKDYKYRDMLADINTERNLPDNPAFDIELFQGLIPTHSHLIGAWVSGGILASLVWFYLFWIAIRSVIEVASQRPPLAPLYGYLLTMFLWDIWFSPFGSSERPREAGLIIIMVDLLQFSVARSRSTDFARRFRWRRRRFAGPMRGLQPGQPALGDSAGQD
jgi:hypothetical protein